MVRRRRMTTSEPLDHPARRNQLILPESPELRQNAEDWMIQEYVSDFNERKHGNNESEFDVMCPTHP